MNELPKYNHALPMTVEQRREADVERLGRLQPLFDRIQAEGAPKRAARAKRLNELVLIPPDHRTLSQAQEARNIMAAQIAEMAGLVGPNQHLDWPLKTPLLKS